MSTSRYRSGSSRCSRRCDGPSKHVECELAVEVGGMDDRDLERVRVQVRRLAVQKHGVHAVESLHVPPRSRPTALSKHYRPEHPGGLSEWPYGSMASNAARVSKSMNAAEYRCANARQISGRCQASPPDRVAIQIASPCATDAR